MQEGSAAQVAVACADVIDDPDWQFKADDEKAELSTDNCRHGAESTICSGGRRQEGLKIVVVVAVSVDHDDHDDCI